MIHVRHWILQFFLCTVVFYVNKIVFAELFLSSGEATPLSVILGVSILEIDIILLMTGAAEGLGRLAFRGEYKHTEFIFYYAFLLVYAMIMGIFFEEIAKFLGAFRVDLRIAALDPSIFFHYALSQGLGVTLVGLALRPMRSTPAIRGTPTV